MIEKSNFFARFQRFVVENKLVQSGDKVLVGFSGGADSTALLLALSQLKTTIRFSILAAHINYQLRGEESDADEHFVKEFCFSRNIALVTKTVKITTQSGVEAEARDVRFRYFNALSKLYKVHRIALGHHQGDQAETMLFRLIRGSGINGLKGITPISGSVIHPLLPFTRDEITAYLQHNSVSWREDLSNQNTIYSRNMIRNDLIPWIQNRMNPRISEQLAATATVFYETDQILGELASRRLNRALLHEDEECIQLKLNDLLKWRSVLRFYIYRRVFERLSGSDKDFYQSHFEAIEAICSSDGSKYITLPRDVLVQKQYNQLIFRTASSLEEIDVTNSKVLTSVRSRFSFEGWRISMKKLKKMPAQRFPFEDSYSTYIDLDKTSFPITIRHRLPGDRFHPLGMQHSKKLKDFFIDEKVPKFDRDKALIFCDDSKIIWVCGHRVDNRVVTDANSNSILRIRVERVATRKMRAAERVKMRDYNE
jgi:tRNA(Ile)-lysidine synthase